MSLGITVERATDERFPRTRGDEPWAMPWAPALDVFSPHARG